jgi:cell division protein FtsQ
MWDNAPLLRNIANVLLFFSVLAALYGTAYYLAHLPGLFPLQSVRLNSVPLRVEAQNVLQVVRREVQGNFFTVDVERLRQSLEKLSWVRSVSIRREFPHGLAVQLEEHQALAHWNNSALVNRQGEVFVAENAGDALPVFIGQAGDSVEVTQRYVQFNQLLSSLNLQITQLSLSPRHAWQLRLNDGMVLELGREEVLQRLARFVAVRKIDDRSTMKYVDLRYRNGFAVRQSAEDKKPKIES